MRYHPPYGLTDPEPSLYSEPFINGDPSIGREGSIPPAQTFEQPQREIVAVIQYAKDQGFLDQDNTACAAPTDSDLTQLLKAIFGIINSQKKVLTTNVTYYVNPITGSDTSYDGTSATVIGTGPHGPFATLQKAINIVAQFAPGTFGATIRLSASTHDQTAQDCARVPSWAHCTVSIIGAGAGSTTVTSSGAGGGVIVVQGPNNYSITDMTVSYTGTTGNASCIAAISGSSVGIRNITYAGNANSGFGKAFVSGGFGTLYVGTGIILAASVGTAGDGWFFYTSQGTIQFAGGVVTIPGAVTCGYFVGADYAGNVGTLPVVPTFPGAANVTGAKYEAGANGTISAGGITFPGSGAGTTSTGGQYIP